MILFLFLLVVVVLLMLLFCCYCYCWLPWTDVVIIVASEYDLTATYHRKASIQIPYLCTWDLVRRFGKGNRAVFASEELLRESKGGAVAMISNCGAKERKDYLTEMAKYMPIYNAGSCSISGVKKISAPSRWGGKWFEAKNSVVRKYPFYLAFENSNLTDYVTEKLYTGFFAGVVPVYWGSPEVAKVAPPHSFVDANRFDSPKHLALHLKNLTANYGKYAAHFNYLPDGLGSLFDDVCHDSLMCRICRKAKALI